MSKRTKLSTYVENATNIPLECSDVESELCNSDADNSSAIIESSDEEIPDEDNIDQSSESDCENIPNKRTKRCMRFPSSSEGECGSNIPNQQT